LWLFSLEGEMRELRPGAADPAGQFAAAARITAPPGRAPDVARSPALRPDLRDVPRRNRQGGPMGGVALTAQLTTERIMTSVSNRLNAMPAFGTMYSREDLHDLSGYILQELVKN
jgi:hypothetical protein